MSANQAPTTVGLRRRACVNCTAGKSKCLPISPTECERCKRLGKRCVYQNVLNKRKSPSGTSRVKLLEQRIESLLSLLNNQPHSSSSVILSQLQPQGLSGLADITSSTFTLPPQHGITHLAPRDVIDRGLVTLDLAQTLFDKYRTEATYHFPFVFPKVETDINSFRSNSPFLFLCIMASMLFKDCSLQRQLGEEVRIQAHRRVLLESESSLELLQGLLVYLAWYQYHFLPETQQIVQLAQLCVALVHNLGLDQNPDNGKRKVDLGPDETESCRRSPRTTDQLRALLGAFCTASWIATKFRTRCAMPHTRYIERARQILATNPEYPTDHLISSFVQTNELSRRICDTFAYDDLDHTEIRDEFVSTVTVQAFSRELNGLKRSLLPELQQNLALQLEFHLLETLISETSLHHDFWDSSPTSLGQRYKMSRNLSLSCKSLIDKVIKCPEQEVWYLTFYTYAKICRALSCLSNSASFLLESQSGDNALRDDHATNIAIPAGDSLAVERVIHLSSLGKELQQKFQGLTAFISSTDAQMDLVTMFSGMVGAVVATYEAYLREKSSGLYEAPRPITYEAGNNTQLEASSTEGVTYDLGASMPQSLQTHADIAPDVFGDVVWSSALDELAFST
ncbi:hypothetical protein NW759_012651 [Fusarium solani]|uniref:Zn(2)-C6 fungal-type domain-containing protein n=1 Tax=Fusarium solani TaxID=169388 RepID=A0A9P9HEN2_FUSSL|nr:uncharacterized protein B0J15DRAFT_495112 [Fusarium solani]KAH7255054.1 hypothetical protein B0J15DRAFT_495112 [Fusarium solani]KAJ4211170.1 hypothetical protein NW759_012651 [Fusarium solani]